MEEAIVVNLYCLLCGIDLLANYVDMTLITSRTTQSETLVREKLKTSIWYMDIYESKWGYAYRAFIW
jgi:hypothetical protein